MSVTIYHNPDCGTSRNTLAMIRQSGEPVEVIEYLVTPPSRGRLVELVAAMGITPGSRSGRRTRRMRRLVWTILPSATTS